MRIILSDFMSRDGVVQAPGGRQEDTDGGFTRGGWSMPCFDAEAMGSVIDEVMATTQALPFGRRMWQGMAAAWPGRAGDPFADRMNEIPKSWHPARSARTISPGPARPCCPLTTRSARCASCEPGTARGGKSWAAPRSPRS